MRSAALWCWGSITIIAVLLGLCALVSQSPPVTSVAIVGLTVLCTAFALRIVVLETRWNAVKAFHKISDILRNEEWEKRDR